jgi:hypothetical protein
MPITPATVWASPAFLATDREAGEAVVGAMAARINMSCALRKRFDGGSDTPGAQRGKFR